jgi:hypothetical protein
MRTAVLTKAFSATRCRCDDDSYGQGTLRLHGQFSIPGASTAAPGAIHPFPRLTAEGNRAADEVALGGERLAVVEPARTER